MTTQHTDEIFFAEILENLMRQNGLTQLALSKKLGIRQSQIHNWLHKKTLPGFYSIKRLSEVLQVPTFVFFNKLQNGNKEEINNDKK